MDILTKNRDRNVNHIYRTTTGSSSTKAAPSRDTSRRSTPIVEPHSFPTITTSKRLDYSNKPRLSSIVTSIPLFPAQSGRRSSKCTCFIPHHSDSSLTFDLRYRGLKTDDARLAEHLKTLEAKLDVYDVILSKQKYVAGDVSTLYLLFRRY